MFENLKFNFKNKIVLIAGGSRGIGEGLVNQFEKIGRKSILCVEKQN